MNPYRRPPELDWPRIDDFGRAPDRDSARALSALLRLRQTPPSETGMQREVIVLLGRKAQIKALVHAIGPILQSQIQDGLELQMRVRVARRKSGKPVEGMYRAELRIAPPKPKRGWVRRKLNKEPEPGPPTMPDLM